MVIAFHGLQGVGKTSLSLETETYLRSINKEVLKTGIKKTFQKYTNSIINDLGLKMPHDIKAIKQLELAVSTWGETYVDPMIWTSQYKAIIDANPDKVIITDDIRTPQNLEALLAIAHNFRPVFLFALNAPEEIRKNRVSTWRENGGYTEQPLSAPSSCPIDFHWNDIDTSGSLELSFEQIKRILFP